jgi:hypothetical protein
MRRLRLIMTLGAMALAFSGCLSPAPPDGAEGDIDEAQNATSLDETAATEAIAPAACSGSPDCNGGPPPEVDPCPCDNPVCRPLC